MQSFLNQLKAIMPHPQHGKLAKGKKYGEKFSSVCISLLTVTTSIGIGITFNPQRSWAGSTCVGTYSSRSGVTINASGQVVTSTTNSVIGYFNSISNSYVPLVNYTGGNNINAIATQPSTGNLFFINRATGKFTVYNPNTNTQTVLAGGLSVAGPPASTSIIGATFNASGNLYIYYTDKTLIEVNPSSGNKVGPAITISGIPGNISGNSNGDIAIGTNGILYAMGDTGGGTTGTDYTSRLYSIAISGNTATATAVVASNITGLGGSAANGLAIDPATGKFYISSSLGTYELNTATNVATQLTSATGTNDLAACGSPAPDLPTITKAFGPDNVVGTPANSKLTLALGNTNQVPIFLIAPLVDTFQTGLTVRSPNGLSGTCFADTANSNKVTAVANSNSISLSDGLKVPAGGCTVTVDVTASNIGVFTNTIAAGELKTTAGTNSGGTTGTLTVVPGDYGDAPITGTAPNGTGLNAYGEAKHRVVNGMKLGIAIDAETTSIANATASGDGADDDGISSFPALNAGVTSYSIPAANITATGTGTLHAWIDFNKNGIFDVGEYASVAVTNNTPAGALNWIGITAGAAGNTFARFRFTSDTTITASTSSGTAADGEVEDYQVPIETVVAPIVCPTLITGEFGGTFGTIDSIAKYRNLQNPVPGYTYVAPTNTSEGQYIVTSAAYGSNTWNFFGQNITGHTTGAADDAFLLVNGSTSIGTFYQQTINVMPNKDLEVGVWARNWAGLQFSANPPTITLRVYAADGTTLLGSAIVDNVSNAAAWVPALANINTGSNTKIIVKLQNLSTQFSGNDFAIDDFFVRSATVPCLDGIASDPNVLLVKRITAINGATSTVGGDSLGGYIDALTNPYDDNTITIPTQLTPTNPAKDTDKWPTPSIFMRGGIDGGNINPGDEMEYTIYFLSAGDAAAKNVLFCDRVPEDVSYIFNSFGGGSPLGLTGTEAGMQMLLDGVTSNLTNVPDSDVGQYFAPGIDPKATYPNINCRGANTNGAVVVNLGNLPNATAPGIPTKSYGFIRFRGRVK